MTTEWVEGTTEVTLMFSNVGKKSVRDLLAVVFVSSPYKIEMPEATQEDNQHCNVEFHDPIRSNMYIPMVARGNSVFEWWEDNDNPRETTLEWGK